MITVKATFSDGDTIISSMNATEEEAKQYYLDKVFNLGSVRDHLVTCVSVEILA